MRTNSINANNDFAKDLRGINRKVKLGLIERLIRPRDYKPYALQMLQQAGIVHMTENGKLYMTEEKLNESMRCRVVWQQI